MQAQARDAFFIETCLEYVSQGEEPTIAVAEAFSAVAGFYGYEPDTYYQAITCRDAKDWQEAMKKEMDALFKLNAFEYVVLCANVLTTSSAGLYVQHAPNQ